MLLRQIAKRAALAALMACGCSSRAASDEHSQRAEGPQDASIEAPAAACPAVVHVHVLYPGANPEEIEQQVIMPLEDAVSGLQGVRRITSHAREGEARLRLAFDETANAERVRTHLRTHLADTLPAGAEEPTVFEAPARIAWTPIGVREPSETSVVLSLLYGEGIEAERVGARAPLIRIRVDAKRLAAVGLTRQQVGLAIRDAAPPPSLVRRAASETKKDPIGALVDLQLDTTGDAPVRLGDLATIELAQAQTPAVFDASGELGLIAAAQPLPAAVRSRLPQHVQLERWAPISAPRCDGEPLDGLATLIALRVVSDDAVDAARRLTADLTTLDPEFVALVGASSGFGLDLAAAGADLHVLFPTATPATVLERLRAHPEVEPLRVWGATTTHVVVVGPDPQRRARAQSALQNALSEAGFFALAPEPAARPELSISLRPAAAALGFTAADVSRQVRSGVGETPLTLWQVGDVLVPVVFDGAPANADVRSLADLQLRTPQGHHVPLSSVASIEEVRLPAERWRVDRQPARELHTNAPPLTVMTAWKKQAAEFPGIELTAG